MKYFQKLLKSRIKKESFFDFDFFGFGEYIQNFLEYKCCGASTKDKGDYDVLNILTSLIYNLMLNIKC